ESLRNVLVERGARSQDVDLFQAVAQADLVVVEIVRRRDLDAAGAEGGVDVGVGNDWYRPVSERQRQAFADEMFVALVVRIHGDGRVAQHRLRTGGGHYDLTRPVFQRIAQMPKVTFLLLALYFEVGERREQHGVPVDQPLAPID